MNIKMINQALIEFGDSLPTKPEWMLLMRRNGEIITQVGKYESFYQSVTTPLDDGTAALLLKSHSDDEIEMLDQLDFGNLQYSISIGTHGALIILHLHGNYLVGMSYRIIGLESLDALADAIQLYAKDITDSLFDAK